MMLGDLTNFHRTLATTVNAFLRAGFVLERLVEPTVSEENLRLFPDLEDERRVPNFIVYVMRRSAGGASAAPASG
jgi:hypothetical protein